MVSFKISNSVAFVTGTNKKNGIGRAIVHGLLENGVAKVYATARDVSQLDDLVAEYGGKVVAVALDVSNLESIKDLPKLYPDVTLLINNAGYLGTQSSLGDIEVVRQEMIVNYIAPMAIAKSFSPVFIKADNEQPSTQDAPKTSAIVNINSIASLVNFPLGATYSASKAASHSLTQAQRRDFPKSLVVGVYPGPIDTDMAEGLPFDKTPTSAVAQTVIKALKEGTEDVFPDPMAAQLYEGWKADAKAVEQQMARSVAESQ